MNIGAMTPDLNQDTLMRYDYQSLAPTMTTDMRRATLQLHAGPVDRRIVALVELRVSQINGCAFCIDRHAREAFRAGIPLGMVIGLNAWRDDHRFDATTRAALALAEATCDPGQHEQRSAAYAALDSLMNPAEVVHLTMAIALAEAWNRIASGCQRQPADAPWPLEAMLPPRAEGEDRMPSSKAPLVPGNTEEIDEYRRLLRATPAILTSLIMALRTFWQTADGPGRWTIHQVAAHLLHTEVESWMPRIRHIHEQTAAVLPRVEAHLHLTRYDEIAMEVLLSRFTDQRRDNLRQLEAIDLDGDGLARTGEHQDRGRVELRQLISTWCMHDLDHVDQIIRIVGAGYASRVGPMAAFLRICRPMA